MILAGRRINDEMGTFVARRTVQEGGTGWQGRSRGEGAGAWADLQGGLPGPAKLTCSGHHRRTEDLRG